jgi:opacity protein-like surface antigen
MKRKKKMAMAAFSLILLLGTGFAHSSQFGLRLFGGLGTFSPQDINQSTKGWTDQHAGFFTSSGYSRSGEVKPVNMSREGGADLLIYFTPRIALGIGAGYVQGKHASEVFLTKGTDEIKITSQPALSATPIRLGLFFEIPAAGMNIYLNLGADYYLAKYTWDWNFPGMWELNHSATANGLGFHGGIGFEIMISNNVALFLEGTGRSAKIKGFEGTEEGMELGSTWEGSGTLFYLEGADYPVLFIQEEMLGQGRYRLSCSPCHRSQPFEDLYCRQRRHDPDAGKVLEKALFWMSGTQKVVEPRGKVITPKKGR